MSKPAITFEFFPPRTQVQSQRFWRTLGWMETLKPEWMSLTYGALGSGSQASLDIVDAMQQESTTPIAAHLTCNGRSREELLNELDKFSAMGVKHIVALRGDHMPDADMPKDALRYASDLVELIAQRGGFEISVAGYPETHPEAQSEDDDLRALKLKLDLGASRALTQFFFEPGVFLRWRDKAVAMGIDKLLVPGILPVHDIDKVLKFAGSCGANVPADLVERFRTATTEKQKRELSVQHCLELCNSLQREGVNDFHFYTLNQSDLSYTVSRKLLEQSAQVVAA
jgi:methylenetetrahydrofolate reductase (NADPH)